MLPTFVDKGSSLRPELLKAAGSLLRELFGMSEVQSPVIAMASIGHGNMRFAGTGCVSQQRDGFAI